jgi:hypothetical protein
MDGDGRAFLLHVPVLSPLIGLPGGGLTAVVLENAYVWAAWALLLFLPVGTTPRGRRGRRPGCFGTLTPFHGSRLRILLSLVTFAVAAFTVGICGWMLWSRSRAPHTEHPDVAEES